MEANLEKELKDEQRRVSKEVKGANMGSLVRLFKSIHFDIWMAVTYLYRYPTKGINDYICNEFYRLEAKATWLSDFEYYLPQLCHLIVAYPSETKALARYLMDLSSRSIHFALRIGWLFNAIATPLPTSSKTAMEVNERCAELRLKAEFSALNGRRPESLPTGTQQSSSPIAPLSPLHKATSPRMPVTDTTIDPIVLEAMSQTEKYEYYKAVQGFVERLAQISDSLRAIPPLERNAALHADITALNARLTHPANGALLYLPSSTAAGSLWCLLRITPEEPSVLNSRDRAPYILYLEILKHPEPIAPASPYLHLFAKELGRIGLP